jgi:hypothetical protein
MKEAEYSRVSQEGASRLHGSSTALLTGRGSAPTRSGRSPPSPEKGSGLVMSGGPCGGKQPDHALENVTNSSKSVICLKRHETASRNVTLDDQVQRHLRWPKSGTYIRKRGSMWVRCANP